MDNDGELVKTSKTLVGFDQSTTIIPSSSVLEKESCNLDLTSSTLMGSLITKSQANGSGVSEEENVHDNNSVDGGTGGDGVGVGDGNDLSVANESSTRKDIRVDDIVGEESVADDCEMEKESKEVEFEEKGDWVLTGSVASGDSKQVCGRKGFGEKFRDGITSSGRKPFADISSSIAQRTRNRVVPSEKEDIGDVDVGGKGSKIADKVDEDNIFCVGDFVWGKVKSHPWWPGRIYDPSNASEFALKYKHEGRILVAYFGDRTFAWCDPSQLKSFEEIFEEMSKQSSLKTFVNAVEEAENEFGRLVKLQVTCSCVRESQSSLPLVVNAGVKEGVCVPENEIAKFSVAQFESSTMLADIRRLALFDSVANTLELTVLKSRLLAFNHAKFGYSLPIYCEPVGIEDPINEHGVPREASCRGPDDGDWFIGPEDQTLGQNGLLTPHDMSQKRKSKSITELLGMDTRDELEGNNGDRLEGETQLGKSVVKSRKKRWKVSDEDQSSMHELNGDDSFSKDEDQSGKLVPISGRKKRKSVDENKSHAAGNLVITRSSTRKKKEDPVRSTTSDEKASGDSEDRGEVKDKQKTGMVPQVSFNDGLTVEEGYERISPRERKKSKYLSPPYTNVLQRQRSSLSKVGSEAGGLVFSDVARMGESMAKTAGKIVGSPPLVKCSAETFRKSSKVLGSKHEKTDHPDYKTSKPDLSSEANDPEKSIGSLNCVLSEIRSAALDPLYTRRDQTFGSVKGFLSSYRSSNYKNGSNYKFHKKGLAGDRWRKRNLSGSMHGSDSDQKVPNQVDQQTPNVKHSKKSATKEEQKSEPKPDHKVLNEVDQQTPKLKRSKKSATKKEQKSESKLDHKVLNEVDQQTPKPKRSKKSATKKEQKSESKPDHKVLNEVDQQTPKLKRSKKSATKIEQKSESKPDHKVLNEVDQQTPKLKRSKRSVAKKEQNLESKPDHEVSCGPSSSSATLVITFPAGFSLPTKENIIEMCCKFGNLDESKTEVSSELSTAKIVFVQSSYASAAMDSMQKSAPFGTTEVSYKIEHLAAVPVSKGKQENVQNKKKTKSSETTGAKSPDKHPSESPPPESEPLAVIFIKQKLEAMTSMLGQTDGKMSDEIKSNLENDVKELLKKVKKMTATSPAS